MFGQTVKEKAKRPLSEERAREIQNPEKLQTLIPTQFYRPTLPDGFNVINDADMKAACASHHTHKSSYVR